MYERDPTTYVWFTRKRAFLYSALPTVLVYRIGLYSPCCTYCTVQYCTVHVHVRVLLNPHGFAAWCLFLRKCLCMQTLTFELPARTSLSTVLYTIPRGGVGGYLLLTGESKHVLQLNSIFSKAGFTQVKFFNGYPFNYICKFACVASLAHNIRLIL